MEYIRKSKNPQRYTVVNNAFIRDNTISWKAKGLITYMMSLPSDWKINIAELKEHATDGRESVYSGINELINAGYCIRIQHLENGRFAGYEYVVSDDKDLLIERECDSTVKQKCENSKNTDTGNTDTAPDTGNTDTAPDTGNTDTGNTSLHNTNIHNTNKRSTDKQNIFSSIEENNTTTTNNNSARKIFVKPKPEEVDEYSNYLGNHIDGNQFCDYYESKGWMIGKNHMKDWKAAVRTWINKEKNYGKSNCNQTFGRTGSGNQSNRFNPTGFDAKNSGEFYRHLQESEFSTF